MSFSLQVIHSGLIFDIYHKLIDSFKDKDIELIQMFLTSKFLQKYPYLSCNINYFMM